MRKKNVLQKNIIHTELPEFLAAGQNVNQSDSIGTTPLYIASKKGF